MRYLLTLFGILDAILLYQFIPNVMYSVEALISYSRFDLISILVIGHVLLFTTLPMTAIGVPFQKKWAFIVSYIQAPLRIAYATFTFGFLYLLIPYFPDNMPSKSWFVTGIASVLELVRVGITALAHYRLCKWGTINPQMPVSRPQKIVVNIVCFTLMLTVGIGTYYVLSGRIYTSIHTALRSNDFSAIKLMVSRDPRLLNQLDDFGETPLHIAVRIAAATNDTAMVEYLLEHGADANITNDDGDNPLHRAAGNIKLTTLLRKYGADPTRRNKSDETPLHTAVLGDVNAVNILLNFPNVGVNVSDSRGNTPLHNAVENGKITQLLIQHGADVFIKNRFGETALHRAAIQRDAGAIKALLKAKIPLDSRDSFGRSALYVAAASGEIENAEILLKAGAETTGWAHDATDTVMAALQPRPFEDDAPKDSIERMCKNREALVKLLLNKNIAQNYVSNDLRRLFTLAKDHQQRCSSSEIMSILVGYGLKNP